MPDKNSIINEVRSGSYLDSVALMQLSKDIANMDGVEDAAVMMGTSANKKILSNAGLLNENRRGSNSSILWPHSGHAKRAEKLMSLFLPSI